MFCKKHEDFLIYAQNPDFKKVDLFRKVFVEPGVERWNNVGSGDIQEDGSFAIENIYNDILLQSRLLYIQISPDFASPTAALAISDRLFIYNPDQKQDVGVIVIYHILRLPR